MKQDEMTICECVEYLDSMVGDDENIKGCLDYIEFDTIDKTFEASYYDSKGDSHPLIITPKELVAIYEQIDELGGGFNG